MTVLELIIKLQQFDRDKEVLLDFTKPGMEIFKLTGIQDVSDIESNGEGYVMLSGFNYEEDEEQLN